MRLLNAATFRLEDFAGPSDPGTANGRKTPQYAILSHTWDAAHEEVVFQDMKDENLARFKRGFRKIHFLPLVITSCNVNNRTIQASIYILNL